MYKLWLERVCIVAAIAVTFACHLALLWFAHGHLLGGAQ